MSYTYEVDPSLDMDEETSNQDLIVDYDEMFEEEDFAALGIDPRAPTPAKPGSEDKVMMLAARYASGLPLWHDQDCYDHGPLAKPRSEFHDGFGDEEDD
ncbi:MAG: hypothetical protein WD069_21885 [Planctomycetales bacterium]